MNCRIQVASTEHCVGCKAEFTAQDKGIPVRIESNTGVSIHAMCPSCMKKYKEFKQRKAQLLATC